MVLRILFFMFGLLLIPLVGYSQFGVGVRSQWTQNGYWDEVFEAAGGEYPGNTIGLPVMYWFRLKKKRIEFLPEAGYFFSTQQEGGMTSGKMKGAFFHFNTDIYFLDLASDCNCPTFSKQNDFFKRGVFAEVSPGIELRTMEVSRVESGVTNEVKFTSHVPTLSAGLGLDIGVSDLITITPTVGLQWAFNTKWDNRESSSPSTVEEFLGVNADQFDTKGKDSAMATRIGLRVLFRPDYVRGRR